MRETGKLNNGMTVHMEERRRNAIEQRVSLGGRSSSSSSMVEVQQPAQPLRLHDRPFPPLQPSVRKRNHILDPLMIAFGMVVCQILPNHVPQRVLTE